MPPEFQNMPPEFQNQVIRNYQELFRLHQERDRLKKELKEFTEFLEGKQKEALRFLNFEKEKLDQWVEFAPGKLARFEIDDHDDFQTEFLSFFVNTPLISFSLNHAITKNNQL